MAAGSYSQARDRFPAPPRPLPVVLNRRATGEGPICSVSRPA